MRLRITSGLDTRSPKKRAFPSMEELRTTAQSNVEIGNHTLSHSFCRSLSREELERNTGEQGCHEDYTATTVRAFSVPYGSREDVTPLLRAALEQTETDGCFLSKLDKQ